MTRSSCSHGKLRGRCGEYHGAAKLPTLKALSAKRTKASLTAAAAAMAPSTPPRVNTLPTAAAAAMAPPSLVSRQRTSGLLDVLTHVLDADDDDGRETEERGEEDEDNNSSLSSPGDKRTAAAEASSGGAFDGRAATAAGAAAAKKMKRSAVSGDATPPVVTSVVIKIEQPATILGRARNEATDATAAHQLARVASDPAAVKSRGASFAHALHELTRSGDSEVAAAVVTGQLAAALGSMDEQVPRALSVADPKHDDGPFAGLPPLPSSSSSSMSGRATRADTDDEGPFAGFDAAAAVTGQLAAALGSADEQASRVLWVAGQRYDSGPFAELPPLPSSSSSAPTAPTWTDRATGADKDDGLFGGFDFAAAVTGQLSAALGSVDEQAPRKLTVADQQYNGGPFAGLPPLPSSSLLTLSGRSLSGRATRVGTDDDNPFGAFHVTAVTRRLRMPPATQLWSCDADDAHNRPRAIEVAPNTHVEVLMIILSIRI